MEWIYCLMTWFNNLMTQNPTIAIIVTATVTAFAMFLGNCALDNRRQKQRIENFYKAVYGELKEVWNLYNQEVGARWEKFERYGEDVFRLNLSLTQDYFTVYRSNADLIGQIPKSDLKLRSKIVETYTLLKVLIDYYKQNNSLLDEHTESFNEDGNLLNEYGALWDKTKGSLDRYVGSREQRRIAERNLEILNFTGRLQTRHRRFEILKKELFDTLEKKFPELSNQDSADDST